MDYDTNAYRIGMDDEQGRFQEIVEGLVGFELAFVSLKFKWGLDEEEIAQCFGIPREEVASHTRKALGRLAQKQGAGWVATVLSTTPRPAPRSEPKEAPRKKEQYGLFGDESGESESLVCGEQTHVQVPSTHGEEAQVKASLEETK